MNGPINIMHRILYKIKLWYTNDTCTKKPFCTEQRTHKICANKQQKCKNRSAIC